jgi:penicillin amidase
LRTILRVVFWVVGIVVVVAGTALWWLVYRPLPQLEGSAVLPGLQKEVTVERDGWGVPHIRANSLEDLAETQGYVMAQDRLWQMDLLRSANRRWRLTKISAPWASRALRNVT